MNRKNTWILISLGLLFGLICLIILVWIGPIIPGALFGQLQLTRDSATLSPQNYQSAEFVLDQVDPFKIEKGVYIHLQDDVLFWDPTYPGFPRAELSPDEIRAIQEILSGGKLFIQEYQEEGFRCVDFAPDKTPLYQFCPEGEAYWDQLQDLRMEATFGREVGLFLFSLSNGDVAEIRIYPGSNGIGFNPKEKGGEWWFDGVSAPIPGLTQIVTRVQVEPIKVIWPEKNAEQVHKRAQRILGSRYQLALDVVQDSPEVRDVFGEIEVIRPALGNNYSSSWMDSQSIFLTFYIKGNQGDGVVIIQGYDCFDLRMVFEGQAIPRPIDFQCP